MSMRSSPAQLWWRLLRARLGMLRYRGDAVRARMRVVTGDRHAEAVADARADAGALLRVSRFVPGSRCLARAMALTDTLRARGVAARLCLGVRRAPPFGAHAWVVVGDEPVTDAAQDLAAFAELDAAQGLPDHFDP
jgi:transglutaminase-like putative cysteine protease